jgi:hypothetical protein
MTDFDDANHVYFVFANSPGTPVAQIFGNLVVLAKLSGIT